MTVTSDSTCLESLWLWHLIPLVHCSYGYDVLFLLSINHLLMTSNSTCPQVFFLWHLVSFIFGSFVYCILFHLFTDPLSVTCYSTCPQISLWPVISLVHRSSLYDLIFHLSTYLVYLVLLYLRWYLSIMLCGGFIFGDLQLFLDDICVKKDWLIILWS